MHKIFIIEDDLTIAQKIREHLEVWNLEVKTASDFRNILKEFVAFDPHLILLDISLPFFNGYYWCSEIRKISKVPVIFLSSASDNMNIVMAMNMGGDDFIAKPQTVKLRRLRAHPMESEAAITFQLDRIQRHNAPQGRSLHIEHTSFGTCHFAFHLKLRIGTARTQSRSVPALLQVFVALRRSRSTAVRGSMPLPPPSVCGVHLPVRILRVRG